MFIDLNNFLEEYRKSPNVTETFFLQANKNKWLKKFIYLNTYIYYCAKQGRRKSSLLLEQRVHYESDKRQRQHHFAHHVSGSLQKHKIPLEQVIILTNE